MAPLKVVCLISGGKDSFFSILHCMKNGHDIVALANLHPPMVGREDPVEDMDSYMYQTVGHAIIPLYEQALGLPLYRQEISGSAVNQDRWYGPSYVAERDSEDETEALVPLLRRVMTCHPDVNSVSTGAILSDYQRTRVESVAVRLGLTPLSYLWQWPNLPPHSQTSLLEDMASVGQDSRIIKVASGGLDESFLWQNVANSRTISRLEKATGRFGSGTDGAVLGEGGEYETLAVAGPGPLWKARISVEANDRREVAGEAGSATLQILAARLDAITESSGRISQLRTPDLLEHRFQAILDSLTSQSYSGKDRHTAPTDDKPLKACTLGVTNQRQPHGTSQSEVSGHVLIPDVTGEGDTAENQMQSIMTQIAASLQKSGLKFKDVAYTTIILRNMVDFASVNAIYGACFVHPNPPARVTIACAGVLPRHKDIMVSVTAVGVVDHRVRKGLHVQSRSYWAPANIGPYSQAIQVRLRSNTDAPEDALVYVAGQIPLLPASMNLRSSSYNDFDDFAFEAILALQHAERIGRVMQIRRWACAVAFVTAPNNKVAASRAQIAQEVWTALHQTQASDTPVLPQDEMSESFDVWNMNQGFARFHQPTRYTNVNAPIEGEVSSQQTPALYTIRVDGLPRGVSIEWVTYGFRGAEGHSLKIEHLQHLLRIFKDSVV